MKNKNCLVTGAASGIGRVTALRFAKEGYDLILADISHTGLEETLRLLHPYPVQAIPALGDLTQEPVVLGIVDLTLQRFGRLDCAINNAGIVGKLAPIAEQSLKDFRDVVDINLTSVWLCLREEIKAMAKQGGGAIVNVSSVCGIIGQPGFNIYCATKHGVLGLTKALAIDHARHNIRINAVCPGGVNTPLLQQAGPEGIERIRRVHPIGRVAEPEEIADAIYWLCSDQSRFVAGHGLVIDGAASII